VELPEKIQQVITKHAKVFESLPGLPPHRRYDNAIPLKDGAVPPNLRPYRYPNHQKIVIEDMVKEMLAVGIIQNNVSPYASPILLV